MRDDFLFYSGQKYDSMKSRFKAKYKDDKMTLRKAGREVPFSKEEFRRWLLDLINSERGLRCAYCERPLQVSQMEPDHVVPVEARGGSLRLSNLAPACKVCNQRKGELEGDEFKALVKGLKTFPEAARNYILGCLGSAAMGKRNRFFPRAPKPQGGSTDTILARPFLQPAMEKSGSGMRSRLRRAVQSASKNGELF